ncbi:MAG TPA: hypothetical protein VKC54_01185 [Patescibacteria group bacterium]|nr:hypothetical protein [Patescibacteria group bacterium]
MTIIKTEKDRKEFVTLISEAFNVVMIPALDDMLQKIEKKIEESIEGVRKDLGMQINSLDRKFDAQQERLDRHNERIESLEKLHPKGTHNSSRLKN